MTDDEFLHAFFDGSLPNGECRHRDHLRLAWLAVTRFGGDAAPGLVSQGIRHFAAAHGHPEKYHETMTRFWVRIVAHMAHARPDIQSFEQFLAAFPQLLDKSLPLRHWERETMFSPAARATWIEPDVAALPW